MGREGVKQELKKEGEHAPLKPAELAETVGLPDSYGETRVVLLPVDPYLLHVYWEITLVELRKAKHRLGDDYGRSQAVLRCYDVTNIIFDGTNAHSSFNVDIDLQAKNWYVSLWNPEKSYLVELGFRTEGAPPVWLAPKADEHYMLVTGDYALVETVPAPIDVQPQGGSSPQTVARDRNRHRIESIQTGETKTAGNPDLAEMCERSFTFGVSSK
jgi:hypothetical protein